MIEAAQGFDARFGRLAHRALAHACNDAGLCGDDDDEDNDPYGQQEQGENGIAIHVSCGPALPASSHLSWICESDCALK